MKRVITFSTIIAVFSMILFPGCSLLKSPTEPEDQQAQAFAPITLDARSGDTHYGEGILAVGRANHKDIAIDDISMLSVASQSIIPPNQGMTSIKVTALSRVDNTNLDSGDKVIYYQLGPSGTRFDPPAKLKVDWKSVGDIQSNDVFYLNYWDAKAQKWIVVAKTDGRTVQSSFGKGKITFEIPHFSLWAISQNSIIVWP